MCERTLHKICPMTKVNFRVETRKLYKKTTEILTRMTIIYHFNYDNNSAECFV